MINCLGRRWRSQCLGMVLLLLIGVWPPAVAVSQESYRLGPNDVVRIQVYGEDDLTVENKIDGEGNINLPLIGVQHVAGKTIQELQNDLTARLSRGYLQSPKVTAHVTKHRNIYVNGEVKTPGGYPYEDGLTANKAISLAGGWTEKADRTSFKVTRLASGSVSTTIATPETAVLPDDIIVVGEAQRVYVSGEVKTPGRYVYEKGLTVHKAISLAGGRTEKAERGALKLTRVSSGVAETITATPEMAAVPDDIIVVEADNHKFYVSGEVKIPSSYPYKEGLTVHKAIAMAGGLTDKAERAKFQVLRQIDRHEQTLPVELDSVLLPDDIIVVAEAQRVYVSGEVKTPGRYVYEKGLTVHKAISLAGGRTEKAERGTLKLTRLASGVAETITATPEMVVVPDDIIVVEADNHKFYVSGEVKNPSSYPYKDGLTVHKAIAMAGGLTDKAERAKFKVLRQKDQQEHTLPVELDSVLLPDDIIVVGEAQRVYVSGEVKTPGRYVYEKGMTVHKAISLAGGWTEKADHGTIKLTRVIDGVVQSLEVEANVPVLAEDFIVVPMVRKVYINGEVKRAGEYPYERGLTVHKIISMAGGFTDKAAERNTRVLRKIDGQEQSLQVNLETIVLPEDILVVPRSFF